MAVDLVAIVAIVVAASVLGSAAKIILPTWSWLAAAVPAAVGLVSTVTPFLYLFVPVAVTGRTPGKAVMGIRVERTNGHPLSGPRSFLRTAFYLVSVLPLGAGFVWVLFDADRRAWHDHLAGSRVVYSPGAGRRVA